MNTPAARPLPATPPEPESPLSGYPAAVQCSSSIQALNLDDEPPVQQAAASLSNIVAGSLLTSKRTEPLAAMTLINTYKLACREVRGPASQTALNFASRPGKDMIPLDLLEIKEIPVPGQRKLNAIPKLEKVGLGVGQKLMSGAAVSSRELKLASRLSKEANSVDLNHVSDTVNVPGAFATIRSDIYRAQITDGDGDTGHHSPDQEDDTGGSHSPPRIGDRVDSSKILVKAVEEDAAKASEDRSQAQYEPDDQIATSVHKLPALKKSDSPVRLSDGHRTNLKLRSSDKRLLPLSEDTSDKEDSEASSTHANYRMTFAGSRMLGNVHQSSEDTRIQRPTDAAQSEHLGVVSLKSNQFTVNTKEEMKQTKYTIKQSKYPE